jgi:hypothetical protein
MSARGHNQTHAPQQVRRDSIGIIRNLGDSTQAVSGCCLSDVVAADASLPQFLRESPEDDQTERLEEAGLLSIK